MNRLRRDKFPNFFSQNLHFEWETEALNPLNEDIFFLGQGTFSIFKKGQGSNAFLPEAALRLKYFFFCSVIKRKIFILSAQL